MKKQRFLVYTEYVFDGVFDVVAKSKEEARQKVLQDCGLVMGGSIHSTLPDDEINFSSNALNNSWAFNRHPNKRISRIMKVQNILLNNSNKTHANRKFAWVLFFVFERVGDQSKEAKESRMKYYIPKKIKYILIIL